MVAVCAALSKALIPGASIFYDPARKKIRAQVFQSGLVIIEYRTGHQPFYSIVTGPYYAKNTKGSLVGALV